MRCRVLGSILAVLMCCIGWKEMDARARNPAVEVKTALVLTSCLLCGLLVIACFSVLVCVCWSVAWARSSVTEGRCRKKDQWASFYLLNHMGRRLRMFQCGVFMQTILLLWKHFMAHPVFIAAQVLPVQYTMAHVCMRFCSCMLVQ